MKRTFRTQIDETINLLQKAKESPRDIRTVDAAESACYGLVDVLFMLRRRAYQEERRKRGLL